ncbi:hypothetical protein BELL_0270g00070 [Botrytis elliptica]|uniref:2EXR domain-containing protein n=1 Tax=Botrytis elliptica TaxID=278938 RepID=A0A4Z1JZR9_9HELO|nr:hypothetical protein EAE99_006072 [Botrytis elliptica]TGO74583.1 hypothetical protein BELL_0270g00070 [Botrytis elliptica]
MDSPDINAAMKAPSVPALSTFPKFPLFPKEIQLKIWFHALPDGRMFFAGIYGVFPHPQPHPLYDVSPESREVFLKHSKRLPTHTAGCVYAEWSQDPIFYSPLRDTIVCESDLLRTCYLHTSKKTLLSQDLACCDERKRFFAALRHVGVLADCQQYAIPDGDCSFNTIDRFLMLSDGNMSFYAQLFTDYPRLKSFSFVIGSDAVQKKVRKIPGMRSAKANYSKEAILEEFYQEKMEEIRNVVGKWKQLHPEAIFPQIEIVYAAADTFSESISK